MFWINDLWNLPASKSPIASPMSANAVDMTVMSTHSGSTSAIAAITNIATLNNSHLFTLFTRRPEVNLRRNFKSSSADKKMKQPTSWKQASQIKWRYYVEKGVESGQGWDTKMVIVSPKWPPNLSKFWFEKQNNFSWPGRGILLQFY